ncbi:MAG TPA: hypothetical protein VNK82_09140 [Terriglobales bacterium]|nr:hypothetical protein [Terriglobales bacterium]
MTRFDEERLAIARMCADLVQQLRAAKAQLCADRVLELCLAKASGAEAGYAPAKFSEYDFRSDRLQGKRSRSVDKT